MTETIGKFVLEDIGDLRRESLMTMAVDFNKLEPILEAIDATQAALVQAHKSASRS